MGLEINQVFGRVGINTTDALIDINSSMPVVEARIRPPRIRIETRHVQVSIDQEQCFAEVGLKPAGVFTRETAQKSRSKGLKATAAIARKGDFLARIDKNPDAIPLLAKSAMQGKRDYTVKAVPKSRPRIHFTGSVDINWEMGDVEFETREGRTEISATRARVDIYLIQEPYIEIQYQGRVLDRSI